MTEAHSEDNSQLKAILERMETMEANARSDMQAMEKRMEKRMQTMETSIRSDMQAMEKHMEEMNKEVSSLKLQFQDVKDEMSYRATAQKYLSGGANLARSDLNRVDERGFNAFGGSQDERESYFAP